MVTIQQDVVKHVPDVGNGSGHLVSSGVRLRPWEGQKDPFLSVKPWTSRAPDVVGDNAAGLKGLHLLLYASSASMLKVVTWNF